MLKETGAKPLSRIRTKSRLGVVLLGGGGQSSTGYEPACQDAREYCGVKEQQVTSPSCICEVFFSASALSISGLELSDTQVCAL